MMKQLDETLGPLGCRGVADERAHPCRQAPVFLIGALASGVEDISREIEGYLSHVPEELFFPTALRNVEAAQGCSTLDLRQAMPDSHMLTRPLGGFLRPCRSVALLHPCEPGVGRERSLQSVPPRPH